MKIENNVIHEVVDKILIVVVVVVIVEVPLTSILTVSLIQINYMP
jgi:hypothetical protein